MSSTNRSKTRDKHKFDYYVTPHKPIYDLFKKLKEINDTKHLFEGDKLNKNITFLDPCAGGDIKNVMSYPYVINTLGGGYSN